MLFPPGVSHGVVGCERADLCVQVLVEMDDVDIDSQAFTEDTCRKRWSLLDMTEFERRRGIARELMTMREVMETKMSNPSTPQTSERHFGEKTASLPSAGATGRVLSACSSPSLVPDPQRIGASLAPAAHRMAALAQGAHASADLHSGAARTEGGPEHVSLGTATNGVHRDRQSVPVRSSPPQATVLQSTQRKEAWGASASPAASEPSVPTRTAASQSKESGDSDNDTDDSEDVEVVDPSELRRQATADSEFASGRPSTAHGSWRAVAAANGSADEMVGSMARPRTAPSQAEFEKSVQDEQLERSDFTIFTHDLKKTCDGFYNAVKANLPSIQVEEVSDDDDDDIAPVFSNLQVNDKGEYVGKLRVGPLLPETQSVASSVVSAVEQRSKSVSSPAPAISPRPAAAAPLSIVAPSVKIGDDLSSSEDEVVQVIDSSELRRGTAQRRAMGLGNGSAAPDIAKTTLLARNVSVEGKQASLDGDVQVLRRAEAELHNAMLGRAARKEAVPPPTRNPEDQATLDQKMLEAVQKSVVNVELEAARGISCLAKGLHDQAVVHLSEAISAGGLMAPVDDAGGAVCKMNVNAEDGVKWLVARGKCYLELSQCYNAVPDLAKAVSLDSASVDARLQYAISLRFSCRYVEAAEQIKYLLQLEPAHAYGKLEQRRLQQRIAHAHGQDLDTWRRKDSVITTAKEIQARAEKSIQDSKSKIESLSQRQKEKELEHDFFEQIAHAKEAQEAECAWQAQLNKEALLDVDLGGIDVDDLLKELQDMQPDPNIFANALRRIESIPQQEGEALDTTSLPPLLQALAGPSGTLPNMHTDSETPPQVLDTASTPAPAATEAAESKTLQSESEMPTALEVGAGARALKSDISSMFPSDAEFSAAPQQPQAHHSQCQTGRAQNAAPLPAPSPAPRVVAAKEEPTAAAPIIKGSIGAKLRALREGQAASAIPTPCVDAMIDCVALAESTATVGARAATPVHVPEDMAVTQKEGNVKIVASPHTTVQTPKQRQEVVMQKQVRGRMQMAGSDDDDDDSEEEQDIMALRSKMKERSKKLSPEEQEAETRKKEALKFLECRAQQDREDQERRRKEDEKRKQEEEARKKQLDDLATESARKRREMDKEREERDSIEKLQAEQHRRAQVCIYLYV